MLTHIIWDTVESEAENVSIWRHWRTVSDAFVNGANETVVWQLTVRQLHIEEYITRCWALIKVNWLTNYIITATVKGAQGSKWSSFSIIWIKVVE